MKSSVQEILPIIGTGMDGGFYAGRINIDSQVFALIVAPKSEGETKPTIWIPQAQELPGAKSYYDGLANTKAMAEAGSKIARWAIDLRIDGHDDWYLPSQDELEIIYRNLKPTTEKNWCYARSGINLSAVEPPPPYVPSFPVQTLAEAFQAGGEQAFEADWYWSSTQHAAISHFAWAQFFDYGDQNGDTINGKLRARVVRRLPFNYLSIVREFV